MSLALSHAGPPAPVEDTPLSAAVMEAVFATGDLNRLSTLQRVEWYVARCRACGLDPATQPFLYVTLQGKLTLYATKACAEQLRKIHGVSVVRLDTKEVQGVYVVTCEVRDKAGRHDISTGAVVIKGLVGEALCNALMKAETKAKRRATLSLCGLGMLDETELDTIPDARLVEPDAPARNPTPGQLAAADPTYTNDSGYGKGVYASPDQAAEFGKWVRGMVDSGNQAWLDYWARNGVPMPEAKEAAWVASGEQMIGHLLKWCVTEGRLKPVPTRVNAKGVTVADCSLSQREQLVAVEWHRDFPAVEIEAQNYWQAKAQEKIDKHFKQAYLEIEGDSPADPDGDDEPGASDE